MDMQNKNCNLWEVNIIHDAEKNLQTIATLCYHNNLNSVYSKKLFYQCCFTEQLIAMYQIANCHVKVCRATAPVGYFGEWIHSQYVLPPTLTNHVSNSPNNAISNNKQQWIISAGTTCPTSQTNNLTFSIIITVSTTASCILMTDSHA